MLLIYYNINELGVGSNMIFLYTELATLLFFTSKIMLHRCICTGFAPDFHRISGKIEKNLPIFCNFFLLCINDLEES